MRIITPIAFLFSFALLLSSCRTTNYTELSADPDQGFAEAKDVKTVYNIIEQSHARTEQLYNNRKSKAYVVNIATINVGMLYSKLRFIGTGAVPYYYERRAALEQSLKDLVESEAPIFVCMQELFYPEDVALVEAFATDSGYRLLRFSNGTETGVSILYRERNLKPTSADEFNESAFTVVLEDEKFMDRATVGGVFRLNNGTPEGLRVLVATAHLSFALGVKENEARLAQIEKLTTLLKEKAETANADAIFLGADFNLSPVVGSHVYASGKPVPLTEEQTKLWAENTKGYTTFYNQMREYRSVDTWYSANPLTEALKNKVVIEDNDPQRALVGFTEDPMNSYLTRTGSTTKEEPAQRLDLIWAGTKSQSNGRGFTAHTLRAKNIFAEPLKNKDGSKLLVEGQPLHLSDHFGVLSSVAIWGQSRD